MTTAERFWSKTSARDDGCIVWTGAKNDRGYGWFHANNKMIKAHRWVYEYRKGPIPAGLVIDHLCRNPSCVNPDHLEVVTAAENTRRGNSPVPKNALKTHCLRGHEYTPENTLKMPGGRNCRVCKRTWRERARAKGLRTR